MKARNTVVSAGDANYLWGLFLLVASMRRHGMDEPVLAGVKGFTKEDRGILEQLGGVEFAELDGYGRSLTCAKAELMLAAGTEAVTWADSDAIFTGNCSELLAPRGAGKIHVRRRGEEEMGGAFPPPFRVGEILEAWERDAAAIGGRGAAPAEGEFRSCSACFLSVGRERVEFLEFWKRMMETYLPGGNAGVVDRSLRHYHQLDESCLNAALLFAPGAPEVEEPYRMDKEAGRTFVHFVGPLKPWQGWTARTVRHFRAVTEVVDWAAGEGLRLPGGKAPWALRSGLGWVWRAAAGPWGFAARVRRKLGRMMR